MRIQLLVLLVLLTLACLFTGCSSIEKKDAGFKVGAVDVVKYAKQDLQKIEADNAESISKGEEDQLPFFAPETFKIAKYYQEKVGKNIKDQQNRTEIIRESELMKKYLEDSYALKDTLSLELKDILEVNQYLRKLNVPETHRKQFNKFQERISEMIVAYEKKQDQKAFGDRQALLAEMQNLEASATIEIVLGPAKKVLDDMVENDLDEEAPVSMAKAREIYKNSEASIWQNCRDRENLEKVGATSLFWATRALNIGKETLRLKDMDEDDFENIVLDEEKRLYTIGQALAAKDCRDLPLEEQTSGLVKMAASLAGGENAPAAVKSSAGDEEQPTPETPADSSPDRAEKPTPPPPSEGE